MSGKSFSGFKLKSQSKPSSAAPAAPAYQTSGVRPSYAPNFSRKHVTEEE